MGDRDPLIVSTDDRLRLLERRAKETRAPADHLAWRQACVRLGQPERAGLEVGDLVDYERKEFCNTCGHPRRAAACASCGGTGFVTVTARGRLSAYAPGGSRVFDVPFPFDLPAANVRLVAPRDPVRARKPLPFIMRLPAGRDFWRPFLAPHVARVLEMTQGHGAPEKEIREMLRAACGFLCAGASYPTKAWRAEVRAQRGLEPHPIKAARERAAAKARAVPLFDGGKR